MVRTALFLLVLSSAACSSSTTNPSGGAGGASGAGGATGGSGGAGGATGGAGGATGGAGGATGGASGSDAGTDAAACSSTNTVTAALLADTTIFPEGSLATPNCEGTITQGPNPVISVGGVTESASRMLLRFQLDLSTANAIAAGNVKSAKLTLQRDTLDDCPNPCPVAPGNLIVFPLTGGWAEGTGAGTGANWCFLDRQTKAQAWGSNGADKLNVDHGEKCGQAQFNGTDAVVAFDLDPKPFDGWVDATKALSLLVVPAGATLFAYSKEHPSAAKPPTLTLEVCN